MRQFVLKLLDGVVLLVNVIQLTATGGLAHRDKVEVLLLGTTGPELSLSLRLERNLVALGHKRLHVVDNRRNEICNEHLASAFWWKRRGLLPCFYLP